MFVNVNIKIFVPTVTVCAAIVAAYIPAIPINIENVFWQTIGHLFAPFVEFQEDLLYTRVIQALRTFFVNYIYWLVLCMTAERVITDLLMGPISLSYFQQIISR